MFSALFITTRTKFGSVTKCVSPPAFPLASLCAGWYICILPLAACFDSLAVIISIFCTPTEDTKLECQCTNATKIWSQKQIQTDLQPQIQGTSDMLLRGVQAPHLCTRHMLLGTPLRLEMEFSRKNKNSCIPGPSSKVKKNICIGF